MSETELNLEQVLAAARLRRAPLTPETAGYIALAVADSLAVSPGIVRDHDVVLGSDGTVVVSGAQRTDDPASAERSVRLILGKLLGAAAGSAPALNACARRGASAGMRALVEQLEAALIPVNREAARRAIARLAREASRAPLGWEPPTPKAAPKSIPAPTQLGSPRSAPPASGVSGPKPSQPPGGAKPTRAAPPSPAGQPETSGVAEAATEPEYTRPVPVTPHPEPTPADTEIAATQVREFTPSVPIQLEQDPSPMPRAASPVASEAAAQPRCTPSHPQGLTPALSTYDPSDRRWNPESVQSGEGRAHGVEPALGAASEPIAEAPAVAPTFEFDIPDDGPLEVVPELSPMPADSLSIVVEESLPIGLQVSPFPVQVRLSLDALDPAVAMQPDVLEPPDDAHTRPDAPLAKAAASERPAAEPLVSEALDPTAGEPNPNEALARLDTGELSSAPLAAAAMEPERSSREVAGERKELVEPQPTPPPPDALALSELSTARVVCDGSEGDGERQDRRGPQPEPYARPKAPRLAFSLLATLLIALLAVAAWLYIQYPGFFTGR